MGWVGIAVAMISIFMLSYQPKGDTPVSGYTWMLLTAIPLVAWGARGFVMRFANNTMRAESIFFYMTISSVALIPAAIYMTDFNAQINWGVHRIGFGRNDSDIKFIRGLVPCVCFSIW